MPRIRLPISFRAAGVSRTPSKKRFGKKWLKASMYRIRSFDPNRRAGLAWARIAAPTDLLKRNAETDQGSLLRLVLLGRHQKPVPAQEIVFLANGNLPVALGDVIFWPVRTRIGVAHIFFIHGPRTRQSMIDRGDFVVKDIWIGLVAVDALLEDRLIVEVQRQAGFIVSAGSLEAARLDLEHVVSAISVLIDPFADRVARQGRLDLLV